MSREATRLDPRHSLPWWTNDGNLSRGPSFRKVWHEDRQHRRVVPERETRADLNGKGVAWHVSSPTVDISGIDTCILVVAPCDVSVARRAMDIVDEEFEKAEPREKRNGAQARGTNRSI